MLSLSLPQVRPAQPVRQNGHAVLTPAANEQVRDLTGRTYGSVSQVNGFRRCPRIRPKARLRCGAIAGTSRQGALTRSSFRPASPGGKRSRAEGELRSPPLPASE